MTHQPSTSHLLQFIADFDRPEVVEAYDEVALWSAMFGLLLFERLPLRPGITALDVGCGTGFPLLELAQRLGPGSTVYGIDPWEAGLARAERKRMLMGLENVVVRAGDAAAMPFDDAAFDLVVSNLGVNNFKDPPTVVAECRRVLRDGGIFALTTNLQGHMQELYDDLAAVLGRDFHPALDAHIRTRATIPGVTMLLEAHGFRLTSVYEDTVPMRFASGSALLNHYFIKLGFLGGWKSVVPEPEQPRIFAALEARLNDRAERENGLTLTIPRAYFQAV